MAGSPKYKSVPTKDVQSTRKPSTPVAGFKPKPVWVGFIVAGVLCLTGLMFTFRDYHTPVRRRGMAGPQFSHDPITLQAHYVFIDSAACLNKVCKSSASPKSFSKFAAKPSLQNAKALTNQTELLRKVLLSGISTNDIRSVYRQLLTRKTNQQLETSFNVDQRRLRPVKAFLQSALGVFGSASMLKCSYDPLMGLSLTHDKLAKKGCLKYVLAAHFKDQAQLLPNFIVQILRVILALPPNSVYVSVVGASQVDNTSLYLDVLKLLLVPIETSARIESSSKLLLEAASDPVLAAANIRNNVIVPFFDKKAKPDGIVGDSPYCFNPDYVVYMSEAAFCPHDVIRLMLHRVDITCGLGLTASITMDDNYGRRLLHQSAVKLPADAVAKRKLLQGYFDDEYDQDYDNFSYEMYDEEDYEIFERTTTFTNSETASVRDITGQLLSKNAPYFKHAESKTRAMSGVPVQVYCCWSGVVVLRAQPFKNGIRFRVNKDGECRSSEKSLLCDDFRRINQDLSVLDASVRITNTVEGYRSMNLNFQSKNGFKTMPWQNAAQSEPAPMPPDAGDRAHVQCCEREVNTDKYNMATCKEVNTMATNYTKIAFN